MRHVVSIGAEIIKHDMARYQSGCCVSGLDSACQHVWSIVTTVSAIEVGRVFQALQASLLGARKRVKCIHNLRGIMVWRLWNVQEAVREGTDDKATVTRKWPLHKVEANASGVDNGDSGSGCSWLIDHFSCNSHSHKAVYAAIGQEWHARYAICL